MIRKITASGTPYQVGLTIGKKAKKEIQEQLLMRKKLVPLHKKEKFKKMFKSYYRYAQQFPKYIEELKGIAEGSETNFLELFKFNLLEFWFLEKERCTSLAYNEKDELFLFHNEDGALTRDIFLAEITYENGVKILSICYYGILPGISVTLNNYGVCISLNSLLSNDWQEGVPLSLIFRKLIESKTIEEGLEFIKKTKRARSENFILMDEDRVVNIETSASDYEMSVNQIPFCHTNNYILPKMKKYENSPYLKHSQTRYEYCCHEIKKQKLDFSKAKKILSSHKNKPAAICRHGEDKRSKTLAAIRVQPSKKEMLISYGPLCQNKFHKFNLT
tara:strand:- start:1341 stop:2336 length:996 start_codon:yes stop_codon:yes gene_type:complete